MGRAEIADTASVWADAMRDVPALAMPPDARTLFNMLLTFVETAHPIELNWTTTDIDDAFALDRMAIEPLKVYPPR